MYVLNYGGIHFIELITINFIKKQCVSSAEGHTFYKLITNYLHEKSISINNSIPIFMFCCS